MNEQLADYHIHTTFCNHANGTMRQYVKQAISVGLREMGFSDHNPLPAHFNNHYRMLPDELQIYLDIISSIILKRQLITWENLLLKIILTISSEVSIT
jgi:HisJ family histidinol phosphate phosphatase